MAQQRKKHIPDKYRWLDERLQSQLTNTNISLSLKYRSLSALFEDASDDELLRIKKFLDAQLNKRARTIEIALWEGKPPTYVTDIKSSFFRDSYLYKAIDSWLDETDYGKLKDNQRHILVRNLEEDFYAGGPYFGEAAAELEKLGVDISEEEYGSLVSEITATVDTTEGSSFDEYLKVYPDNKWMIEALKEHPVEDVLIYQLKVPLGKSFIIQRDPDYGEYPAIIDEY